MGMLMGRLPVRIWLVTLKILQLRGKVFRMLKIPEKKKKEKKGEVNQDALGAEGVYKVEVEVTTKKSKKKKNSLDHKTDNMEEDSKKKNDEKGEADQNALGAEGVVSKVEVKTKKSKKKKNSFDHKTDDMEEKDDVS